MPDGNGLYGAPCWWRVTSQQARMGPLDARLLLAPVFVVLWPSWLTMALTAIAVFFFVLTFALSVRPESALRAVRATLAGSLRPAGFRPPRAMLSMTWEGTPGAPPGPRPPGIPPAEKPADGDAKGFRYRLLRVMRRRRSGAPAEAPPASDPPERR